MGNIGAQQKNSVALLAPTGAPEIVIGLVAPLGTNLELVTNVLQSELRKLKYNSDVVQLSTLLQLIDQYRTSLLQHPLEEYYRTYMDAGTRLRETTKRGDALALLAISKLRQIRTERSGDPNMPAERQAYILRSLKHPEEVASLRKVYGRGFVLVSVYSPREHRVDRLAKRLAEDEGGSDKNKRRSNAEELIIRDEQEEGHSLGQNVTNAFPLGDFFVDATSRRAIEESVSRFLQLYFGHPFHTPTRDEIGMFQARAAALVSSDLSRQVGAAITTDEGEIICVGCNEVPKAFGGVYSEGDEYDHRDFQLGYDSNAEMKRSIIKEILLRFREANWLSEKLTGQDTDTIVESLVAGKNLRQLYT